MGPAPRPGPAPRLPPAPPRGSLGPRGAFPLGRSAPTQQWKSRGLLGEARAGGERAASRRRAGGEAMCGRLWLGLAWLLLARAPGAAGSPSSPRRPRSYPHLEGDVRWRRLFSSTHFFLRVDPSGRVQGTRWRHSPDSESRGRCPDRVGGRAFRAKRQKM